MPYIFQDEGREASAFECSIGGSLSSFIQHSFMNSNTDGMVAGDDGVTRKRPRGGMVLKLELVRGSSFVTDDAAAAVVMDAGVWGRMPEEMM